MIKTDIEIRVVKPEDGVYHLVFANQRDLAQSMMRLQEYYEGPSNEIRGQYFSLEQFLHHYTHDNGQFSYTDVWGGFNVPGDIADEWHEMFSIRGLTHKEKQMIDAAIKARGAEKRWYLIATAEGGDGSTIDHEIAHARYYLRKDYREAVDDIIEDMHPQDRENMEVGLTSMGYCKEVLPDEIQAYLITSGKKDLQLRFGKFHRRTKAVIKALRTYSKEFK